ncbi:MAG: DUF2200 domain-containing protein [Spirochaetaceae bacterium]|nr:DUF2200 domain-containing protein [Spirochaetaceae bacterium]
MEDTAKSDRSRVRMYRMPFGTVYPLYVQKAERKGRTRAEVDEIIRWLTGYSQADIERCIQEGTTLEGFFRAAPCINPGASLVTGAICGIRVETIEDPIIRLIRTLDRLIDELARGRPMEKILRQRPS